ncbi:NIPA-like protein 3 isoform X2 [Narcine bancroftii]|uniref:NIPA-like protein 3 isoform X2 n=1 Tax=Narcine bancroftii TaxID=1343680 RepID=UPI003831048B
MQKYSHVKLSSTKDHRSYFRTKTWWLGLWLMLLGELGVFIAYAYAPVSLITPLSAVSIVASSIIGIIFLRDKWKPKEFLTGNDYPVLRSPILLQNTKNGLSCCYSTSGSSISTATEDWEQFKMHQRRTKGLIKRAKINYESSVTVVAAKGVSGMIVLSIQGNLQLSYPIFYVMFVIMVATAVFQATFLREVSELYDPSQIAGVSYIFSTTIAVTAGATFYLEFNGADALHICMFVLGSCIAFLGVFLSTQSKKKAFEPYISMDVIPDLRSMFAKSPVQPELSGSFYGTLEHSANPAESQRPEVLPEAQHEKTSHPVLASKQD